MNKVLEIYMNRKEEKFMKDKIDKIESIKMKDETYKEITEFRNKHKDFINFMDCNFIFSKEIQKEIKEVDEKYDKNLKKLDIEIAEIRARLNMCENYEQKEEVLIIYGVIDKDTGKISIKGE